MRIVIEADAIVADKMSGIGHATLEMIRSISMQLKDTQDKLIIIIPFGTKKNLLKHELESVTVRQLPPFYKYVNYALTRTSLPIPMDLLYGRGTYIFPNYKNWYVPFSRSITFVHDVAFKILPDTTNPKNLAYLNANFARWLKRTNTIVAISNASKHEIATYFPKYANKIERIYLGIDENTFYKQKQDKVCAVLKKYNIQPNYFVYVGNIEPRKNLVTLLDAYREYIDTTKDNAQLVIIGGDGWNNGEIVGHIQKLIAKGYNINRPSQYVEDDALPAIYSGCRALVHIALHEGFGLSPVQAQACGAPVVASNLAVFRETLDDAKLFTVQDPSNVHEVAEAMKRAGAAGHNRRPYKTQLTWSNTARRLLSLVNAARSKR